LINLYLYFIVNENSRRIELLFKQKLLTKAKHLNQSESRIRSSSPRKELKLLRKTQTALAARLLFAKRQKLNSCKQSFKTFSKTLHAVSPLATLDRGFSITRDQDQNILKDTKQINIDDTISIQLKKGLFTCTVDSIDKDKAKI